MKRLNDNLQNHSRCEWILFYGSIAIAVAACALMAPWDKHFFVNFSIFFAAPMVAGIGLVFFRPALAAGASLGFCIACARFYFLIDDSMGWLTYPFSLPAPFLVCLVLPYAAKSLTLCKAFALSIVAIPAATYLNFLAVNYIF